MKPVLDTPLPPNVKSEPTHKPWRIGNLSGEWHGDSYVQIEDGWRVTYWNCRMPEHLIQTLTDCVVTWEPLTE